MANDCLSSVSKPVPDGFNIDCLIMDMRKAMAENKALGLSAVQVGVLKRVIIINVDGFRLELINPEITKEYGGLCSENEGCVSFPGKLIAIKRHRQITVEGYTPKWRKVKRKLKGLPARVVQHEIDHLNGITIENYEE